MNEWLKIKDKLPRAHEQTHVIAWVNGEWFQATRRICCGTEFGIWINIAESENGIGKYQAIQGDDFWMEPDVPESLHEEGEE